ncbi:MAG: FHA domain-containing protein [Rhodomicrobium sp.]
MLRLALVACLLLLTGVTAPANATTVILPQCVAQPTGNNIVCDVRFGSNRQNYLPLPSKTPDELRVRWPDGQEEKVQVTRYDPDKKTTALLFMIDLSLSMKASTVKKLVYDLSGIVGSMRGNEQIGLATFAEDLNIVAPVGSSQSLILERLSELKPYGSRTFIARSAISGLDLLAGSKADRKALVLLTDGKEEDVGVNERELIDHAKELRIPIYTVGYVQDIRDRESVRWLERVASETYGPSTVSLLTDGRRFNWRFIEPDITRNIFRYIENGGTVTFPRRGNEFNLIADVDGEYVSSSRITFLAPAPVVYKTPEIVTWLKKPEVFFPVLIFLIAGALSLGWLMLRTPPQGAGTAMNQPLVDYAGDGGRARLLTSDPPARESGYVGDGFDRHDGPGTAGELRMLGRDAPADGAGTVYAWLERLDRPGEQIAVKKTSVTIGRHEDNDVKFEELSVHRRHAVLHMSPQREFLITDLSREGGNGVKVNSKKVEKQALREGDVVELGTVRLAFHVASA